MKKSDLKTGMIVVVRNDQHYMVMLGTGIYGISPKENDVLWWPGGFWMPLADYDEDLKNLPDENDFLEFIENGESQDAEFDIVKVYAPKYAADIGSVGKYRLIYERKEGDEK